MPHIRFEHSIFVQLFSLFFVDSSDDAFEIHFGFNFDFLENLGVHFDMTRGKHAVFKSHSEIN